VEILRKIQKFVAKNAAIIIVPSEYLKRVIFKWGIPADKIRVVYNAVEKPRQIFSAVSRDFILSVGRLVPWKGFGTLIEIMKELPKEIKLIIIGSGPEYYNLKFKIENLKLNEQVKLIQQLPHEKLLDYFTKAKIFILNTAYEGLPHVVLEAMAYGAPVIATNVGGNPEVIKNNYNGFLVDYDNKNQLKDAILKLWSDEELRQKFADNSFKESEKFSLDKMIKETIKVLSL
jgi:glycosyltransferase involved in cell wall biosynthesis